VREVIGPERVIYRDGKEPPTVVEKLVQVVRYIDQIVLIPRWGIKAPIHINSLIRRNDRKVVDDPVDDTSNVTSFSKKVS
jgi:hypothetical protein